MVLLWIVHPILMGITISIRKHEWCFFLKMQGERVWNSIEYGWGPPLILDAQGRSTGELKPKHEWDKVDNEGSEANAIFLMEFIQKGFVG